MKDRVCTHAASMVAALLAATALSASAYAAEAPNISGTYWAVTYNAKVQPVGGGELPLTDAGKAQLAKNVAGLNDGSLVDNARKFCVPDGVPRVLSTPYPFEIIQAPPGQVTIIYELNHQIRTVALDKKQQSDDDLSIFPYYNGHSVGHFEGDTLVVETAGFKDKMFADGSGTPLSDDLHTVERIRKTSPTELEDVITIHDPQNYTRDWQARFTYTTRNDIRLEDYVCGEPHRDISQIKGINEARAANARRTVK
jgi:hypothetical protein